MSRPTAAFRCADAARERGDPLTGSAPQARRWLLLEHPGPWPIDAIAGAGIDPPVLSVLNRAAAYAGARILLIRRPGRMANDQPRRWLLCGPGVGEVGGPWTDDRDLLTAADALRRPSTGSDSPPQILVCAHGVHDACCAIRGRPVAAALAEHWPEQVWECSHVGGDRFAPNVVLLPDGFYYGNLDPASAVEVVRRHLAGEVDTRKLRGMAAFPPPVQAAVAVGYRNFGPLPAGAVQVARTAHHGSRTTVELTARADPAARRMRVEVESVSRPAAQLTCRAIRETPATEYQVEVTDLTAPISPGS